MASAKKFDLYYFVTLLLVLISANANILSTSDILWFSVLGFMFLTAVFKKAINLDDVKTIAIFSLVYLIFIVIRDPFINGLDISYLLSDVVFLFKFIILVYLYCLILKNNAAAYIVTVITHLTIISFFFFALQLASTDLIYKISTTIGLPAPNQIPGYTNFLIFTFVKDFHDYSNSGFVWEPAAFGSFLILALLLNLSLNNFKFEKRSYILIAGVITTFATTDYLALLIVFFLVYRYKVPKINIWAIFIILVFAAMVVTIPILGSKISDTYYEDMDDLNRLKFLATYYKHNNMQIPLNRFSSMVYIYDNFGSSLILGVSNKYDAIVNKSYSINISNGIFDFLAKFGLVGLLYLLYRYARFFMKSVLKVEYVIYCILVLLVLGFGEPILSLPIILIFLFMEVDQKGFTKSGRINKTPLHSPTPIN